MDDVVTGKEVFARLWDLHVYRSEEFLPKIILFSEIQNPLRAVLQKQEVVFLKFLQAKRYQYRAGRMTVTGPLS